MSNHDIKIQQIKETHELVLMISSKCQVNYEKAIELVKVDSLMDLSVRLDQIVEELEDFQVELTKMNL